MVFSDLTQDMLMEIEGGNSLSKALAYTGACVLVAVSPAVACVCPPAGAGCALTGAGLLAKLSGH